VGKDAKVYKMYKLRSMKMNSADIRNADGSTFNSANDPRVTKIGKILRKTSLDETAQLINIIKGDMSWIGPRPATPMILENTTELQKARFAVRPGITGYTQMMFRNSAQGEKRYEADKYYVENVSFGMDVSIIIGTIKRVLKRSDLYNDGNSEQTKES
jgi:lipopolysaccharide/colanic/teichoic acid biosynthesis glycosyltransferase